MSNKSFRGRNYNPDFTTRDRRTPTELATVAMNVKQLQEKKQINYEEMKDLRFQLLCIIKRTTEKILSDNKEISQDELAKKLASSTTKNSIIDEVIESGKTEKNRATAERTYDDIMIEYVIQYMINEAKKSNNNIVWMVKGAVTVNSKEGMTFVKEIIDKVKNVMSEYKGNQSSLTRRIKETINVVTNKELRKTKQKASSSEPEYMEL